jgi:ElaB/YqjD/DUF883 family membrane-anchored ribosome-binding protein
MTEFVSNAITSIFIELSAFMTNYEFESRMRFDSLNTETNDILSDKERILTQKATIIVEKMKNIWDFIKKKLVNAQKIQKKDADKHKTISSEYQFEDTIWLFIKNIKIERSFKKLNHKWIDFYKIKKIMTDVCQLNLSQSMKIHDTSHISLLRKVAIDFLIEQISSSSSSIVIEEEKEYEIDDILNSRYHYEKLQYRVEWIDHSSDKAWYLAENFQKQFKKILNDYHQRYSSKSESKLRLIASITSITNHFYWLQQAKNLVKDILNKMKAKMKENDQMRLKESSLINTFYRH